VLRNIDQDPSLESLRELYDQDPAEPEVGIITVTGLKCVGVPCPLAHLNLSTRSCDPRSLPSSGMFKNMHMLDHTESVTMTDESSALRRNMPKRNDEEGGK